jgi:hypothetical protein
MSQRPKENPNNPDVADPRWKDLYRLGAISSILMAVAVLLAIVAYFIWPYKGSFSSMENIFATLQADRLGGLISLDLSMLLIAPLNILVFLALYVVLKRVNESYALIALVVALIAIVLVIQARPLAELTILSDKFAAAVSEIEKNQALAAGEALHAYLDGTAWIMQTVFFMVAGLINSFLMLRTRLFSKATAWIGIIISLIGLGFFLPVIGILLLFLNTIGSVVWCILLARDFSRIGKNI